MRYLKITASFARASIQNEVAYRFNFWISLFYALLNLAAGVLGVGVIFSQVEIVNGWTMTSTLGLLGVYLTLGAIRNLFIGPSLDALAGMDGEIWTGKFDFTMLRPVDIQFLASLRYWRPLAFIDLALGLGVIGLAMTTMEQTISILGILTFMVALIAAVTILYAILLAFSALVLWSPGFLFTWVFDAVFQMARYPVGFYPGYLRIILTWVIPVGVMTTIPAQALTGVSSPWLVLASVALALAFLVAASALFRYGLKRYTSASS